MKITDREALAAAENCAATAAIKDVQTVLFQTATFVRSASLQKNGTRTRNEN